jgi:hypothetical protein
MEVEEQLKTIKAEVDALQIQAAKDSGPWFSKPANLLSVFALVFSFGTTMFSLYRSYQADIASNRTEVRELVQRITRLPIENFELMQKYETNAQGQALGAMIYQEQLLLANQAAEKINIYPKSFNSTEYFAVAGALATANSPTFVPSFLQRAMDLSATANDFIVASRSYGHLLFTQSKVAEGRSYYSKALTDVWAKYNDVDPFYKLGLNVQTSLNLANSEAMLGDGSASNRAISNAQSYINEMPDSPAKDYWKRQIRETMRWIEQGNAAARTDVPP